MRSIYMPAMAHVHAKDTNLWRVPEHALAYLAQANAIPRRIEGETVLLECLSHEVRSFLAGRLVVEGHPQNEYPL